MTSACKINVVCAPSCSRPQLPTKLVRADLTALRRLLGSCGVGGVTEMGRFGPRRAFKRTFGRRVLPLASDAPIALTDGWKVIESGRDFGCARLGTVAPMRTTVWALAVDAVSGLRVGTVSTHMMPGGWRPSPAQRRYVPQILQRWAAHEARLNRRRDWLAARADLVVTLGDINHPGEFTFPGDTRLSQPGLVYIGVRASKGVHVIHTPAKSHPQHADHPAQSTVLTLTKEA